MLELFSLAKEIQTQLDNFKYKFCFIGGIALQAWGENRVTQDVDVSLFTGFQNEAEKVDKLLQLFPARISDARNFALNTSRVLLLKSSSNIGIDVSLAGMPFELDIIERSVEFTFIDDIRLRICNANDLILMKAFAGRDKDYMDIKGVVVKQNKLIDEDFILEQLSALAELKDEPELVLKLKEIFFRFKGK
jgi:predicted nucleotidyltransferase